MFTFLLVVKILLANGEAHTFSVWPHGQWDADSCIKRANEMAQRINGHIIRYRAVRDVDVKGGCFRVETQPT